MVHQPPVQPVLINVCTSRDAFVCYSCFLDWGWMRGHSCRNISAATQPRHLFWWEHFKLIWAENEKGCVPFWNVYESLLYILNHTWLLEHKFFSLDRGFISQFSSVMFSSLKCVSQWQCIRPNECCYYFVLVFSLVCILKVLLFSDSHWLCLSRFPQSWNPCVELEFFSSMTVNGKYFEFYESF